jgi:hypothetical protein
MLPMQNWFVCTPQVSLYTGNNPDFLKKRQWLSASAEPIASGQRASVVLAMTDASFS